MCFPLPLCSCFGFNQRSRSCLKRKHVAARRERWAEDDAEQELLYPWFRQVCASRAMSDWMVLVTTAKEMSDKQRRQGDLLQFEEWKQQSKEIRRRSV